MGWHVTPTGQVRPCPSTTCIRLGKMMERYWDGLRDYPKDPSMDEGKWACGMNKKDAVSLAKTVKKYWSPSKGDP
jgi:hypothetical protein